MKPIPGAPRAGGAHLLSLADLDAGSLESVLERAADLKSGGGFAGLGRQPLAGKSVALIFDKPSLRTRVSFEVGIAKLGGITTTLTGGEVGLGTREPVEDIGRTLSRYVDAVVVRMLDHEGLAALAAASDVPVINALTSWEHPCQALADLLTLRERLGSLAGGQLVYVGDGNNVCHSLLLGGALLGLHVRVAAPPGHEPEAAVLDEALRLARGSGSHIEVVDDPRSAVVGADAVYTDVWASMGSEHEAAARRRTFAGFRLTYELLSAAPDALVMHCLPAHRGEEIDAEVLEGPRSVAFDQAENRLYVQQAALLHLLEARRAGLRALPAPAQMELALAGVARR
ncbi:MAG TPA: ornithine carbamoyltransferase [Candidatus Limnocylindria bacterium]|nr:ornithine carbamoyltransferase [Candidatus Limnocylindria bacterium]